jgi:hypothetical protein
MLSPVFDAFVEASPITVMMRGLMEHIFNFERMNQIFSTYRTYATGTIRSPLYSISVLFKPDSESFIFPIEVALVKDY